MVCAIHRQQLRLLRSTTLWTRVVGTGLHVRRGSDVTEIAKRPTGCANGMSVRRSVPATQHPRRDKAKAAMTSFSVAGQPNTGEGFGSSPMPSAKSCVRRLPQDGHQCSELSQWAAWSQGRPAGDPGWPFSRQQARNTAMSSRLSSCASESVLLLQDRLQCLCKWRRLPGHQLAKL